jgi:hypothetical protein
LPCCDTAAINPLASDDAMAFALLSGIQSVLTQEELIERAAGIPHTAPICGVTTS